MTDKGADSVRRTMNVARRWVRAAHDQAGTAVLMERRDVLEYAIAAIVAERDRAKVVADAAYEWIVVGDDEHGLKNLIDAVAGYKDE